MLVLANSPSFLIQGVCCFYFIFFHEVPAEERAKQDITWVGWKTLCPVPSFQQAP